MAEHCWGMAVLAFVLTDEFPDVDIHRVMEMCLLHDLGEIEGDVPAFEKKSSTAIVKQHTIHF